MTDTFIEQLVKRQVTPETMVKKVILVSLTILSALIILFHPIFILVTIGMIILDSILFKRMNLEYEYSYFNGDLDVDKIVNRSSRKRVFSTNIKKMEMLAPVGTHTLKEYKRLTVYDFTSKQQDKKVYEMVTSFRGQLVRVLFEPNDEMLEAIRCIAPRKVTF